jgi:hypothetical protein
MFIQDVDIMTKIMILLVAMYFWSEDYIHGPTVFMTIECYRIFDKNLIPQITILNKYLCFLIVIAKIEEFDNKKAFLQEWVSYSSHKKFLFTKLIASCESFILPGGIMNKNVDGLSNDVFQQYIKNVYTHYAKDPNIFKKYYSYYVYAIEKETKRIDAEWASPKPQTKTKTKTKTPKPKTQKNKDDSKAKNETEKVVVSVVANTKAVDMVDDDETGADYTLVINNVQIRYLLKSQDYDLIKRDIAQITQYICREVDGCTSIFKDKMSGKYLNIIVRNTQVAHISYYHHSKDLYHFKIDIPEYYGLIDHYPRQYTVPFNFHIAPSTGVITFAIRPIDNPLTEIHPPSQIVDMVKDLLRIHITILSTVAGRLVGRGYNLHRSRRCRRHCKSKRKQGTIRRRRRRV